MPEIKLFYKNCNCCSGSGSGSASGSDSQAGCDCRFLTAGYDDNLRCDGFPVVTECKKNFIVNIYINFSGCVSTPIGNCGSGSSGSGVETGLEVDGSGSGSIPCLTTCPNCCDLVPKQFQINLECIDDTLASTNLIDGFCGSSFFYNETGSTCLGKRADKCTFFIIQISGSSFGGAFAVPIDNGYLAGSIAFANVVSCEPFQLSGSLLFGRAGAPVTEICLAECLTNDTGVVLDPACITGTFTITEALP